LPEAEAETADVIAKLMYRGLEDKDKEGALVARLATLTREFRAHLAQTNPALPRRPKDDANGANLGMYLPEWGALLGLSCATK
jgi:hypothetical protein